MSINEQLLSKLNANQVVTASEILEKIFLKKEKNIIIESEDTQNLITTLIKASEKPTMKYTIFIHLEGQTQKICFKKLEFQDQQDILLNIRNTALISALFNELEDILQKEFLIYCYKKKPSLYQKLKKALKPSISINHGIIIGKSTIGSRQCIIYKDKLLKQIQSPSNTKEDLSTYISSLESILNEKDLESLTELLFTAFKDLQLPLNSKEHFAIYLKFFETSVHLAVLNPQHNTILDNILDHFLISLTALKSDEWHLKILNQLPLFILKKCCSNFSQHEKVKNQKLRNTYLKFYKLIEDNSHNSDIEMIKTAMNFS